MKRFVLTLMIAFCGIALFAQDEKQEDNEVKGFRKDMLFTGGSLNIGYFNGVTVLGATPQLGYSVTNWLDAGIVLGYTYTSQSISTGTKYRQSIFGPGVFARLFPADFIFASVQFEHNFIRQKYIDPYGSDTRNIGVNSLLVGLGYTNGKEGRNTPYYYFSVSVDVFKDVNSPYRTYANEIYPVVNAGFNIPLFQGSGGRRR
ncbi:MAG: hypothetical protein IPP72_09740 [Chitinophagaceae bacterium]|nr:hypothetical protein [Chitinophagaceae bacterium]